MHPLIINLFVSYHQDTWPHIKSTLNSKKHSFWPNIKKPTSSTHLPLNWPVILTLLLLKKLCYKPIQHCFTKRISSKGWANLMHATPRLLKLVPADLQGKRLWVASCQSVCLTLVKCLHDSVLLKTFTQANTFNNESQSVMKDITDIHALHSSVQFNKTMMKQKWSTNDIAVTLTQLTREGLDLLRQQAFISRH